MSYYDLYVGDADDPGLRWEGGNYNGNIPRVILAVGSINILACVAARSLLEGPKYGGRELDWGASGARLTRDRIIEFLEEFPMNSGWRQLAIERAKTLDENRLYVLFACET